jgi:hypothetical protein
LAGGTEDTPGEQSTQDSEAQNSHRCAHLLPQLLELSCHTLVMCVVLCISAAMGDADVELDAVTSSRDVARAGVGLRIGTAITVTQISGALPRLTGITGTLLPDGLIKSSQGLPSLAIHVLNTDTGIAETRVVALDCARRHTLLAARRVASVGAVRGLAVANDIALASHFARRCIAAVYTNWPAHVPLTLGTCLSLVIAREGSTLVTCLSSAPCFVFRAWSLRSVQWPGDGVWPREAGGCGRKRVQRWLHFPA